MTQIAQSPKYHIDEVDMIYEMNRWEEENRCHYLFSDMGYVEKGYPGCPSPITCKITHIGGDYITADSDQGKLYIPKYCITNDLAKFISKYVNGKTYPHGYKLSHIELETLSTFQGFGSCKGKKMPWRVQNITYYQINDEEE